MDFLDGFWLKAGAWAFEVAATFAVLVVLGGVFYASEWSAERRKQRDPR